MPNRGRKKRNREVRPLTNRMCRLMMGALVGLVEQDAPGVGAVGDGVEEGLLGPDRLLLPPGAHGPGVAIGSAHV